MYLSDDIKKELHYFRRLHEHYSVQVGEKQVFVKDADEKILYMLMSASYAMDIFEEGFFENFVLTDKQLTNRQELQLDAYAFIETDTSNEKHLHLFQYKLYENKGHGASPVEVKNFVSTMNDLFVHPELRTDSELNNPVFKEIDHLMSSFLRRTKRIKVKCHFITNDYGINKTNEKTFTDLFGKFEYDKQNHGFDLQVYGEKEVLELIRDGKIRVDKETIEILLDAQQYSYRMENNSKKEGVGLPDKVLIGICNVNELIRLQNKYHHNQLYSENIRLYLGDRQAVNKDIIQTIISPESQWFSYMNNGISVICDGMEIGTVNQKKGTLPVELTNIQIINGCQTVNALYSAKYGEDTRDKFKPSNILIRIYQINPLQQRFKQSIIKATNNQNAVKTYSLLANDPIQIEIQNILKKFGYLYDRKGESRQEAAEKIVSMVQAALAYRAVFEFGGQKLRARIGQSRVFQKDEYERIYKNEYLENIDELNNLSVKLLISSLILNTIKDLINEQSEQYLSKLPVIKKSAYYLSGLYYGMYNIECTKNINECLNLLREDNPAKIKSSPVFGKFIEQIKANFDRLVNKYQEFYDSLTLDKIDIDNLLKSNEFGKKYEEYIKVL